MNLHEQEPRGRKEKVISLGKWFAPFENYKGVLDDRGIEFIGIDFRVREANGSYNSSLSPDPGLDEYDDEYIRKEAYILTPIGLTRHDTFNDETLKEVEDRFESKLLEIHFLVSNAIDKKPARGGFGSFLARVIQKSELPYEFQLRSPFADFSHRIIVDGEGSGGIGFDWIHGNSESGMIFVPQISEELIRELEVRITPSL